MTTASLQLLTHSQQCVFLLSTLECYFEYTKFSNVFSDVCPLATITFVMMNCYIYNFIYIVFSYLSLSS